MMMASITTKREQCSINQNSTTIERHQSLPCEKTSLDSPESFFDPPPDSFWVPKGDENEWFGRNAIIERKSSRKLSFSGNSDHQRRPCSHRSNHKGKTPFLGLPVAQKSCFPDGNPRQNKAGNVHLFRSRSEPGGKPPMPAATEPASPQVSCLGKVGTKKERKGTGVWRSIIAAVLRTGFRTNGVLSKGSVGSVEQEPRPVALPGLTRLESA